MDINCIQYGYSRRLQLTSTCCRVALCCQSAGGAVCRRSPLWGIHSILFRSGSGHLCYASCMRECFVIESPVGHNKAIPTNSDDDLLAMVVELHL